MVAQATHRKERLEKRLSNKTNKSSILLEDMEEDPLLLDNEKDTTSKSKNE